MQAMPRYELGSEPKPTEFVPSGVVQVTVVVAFMFGAVVVRPRYFVVAETVSARPQSLRELTMAFAAWTRPVSTLFLLFAEGVVPAANFQSYSWVQW